MFENLKDIIRRIRVAYMRYKAKGCPVPEFMGGGILIIAPHPDDEVLGCGGLIAKLCDAGRPPHIIYMTGGEGSHRSCCNLPKEELVSARRSLTLSAIHILGVPVENIHTLDYPDGGISIDNKQTDRLRAIITELDPEYVFVPHWGEGWSDHVNTAEIVKTIAAGSKVQIYEYCVWLWFYNIWRGLDWKNGRVLKMSNGEHESKLAAMDAYIKPLAPCGKPWSGVLPKVFVEANKWNRELYFKV